MIEAAATVAAFNGLVRVADGTGIQLDEGLDAASVETRAALGLDEFGGAANTTRPATTGEVGGERVSDLFG